MLLELLYYFLKKCSKKSCIEVTFNKKNLYNYTKSIDYNYIIKNSEKFY